MNLHFIKAVLLGFGFCLCAIKHSYSQNSNRIDSLKKLIERLQENDTARARLLNDYVNEFRLSSDLKTIEYINEAIAAAKTHSNTKELSRAYYYAGIYYRFVVVRDSLAEKYFNLASKHFFLIGNKNLYATSLLQLSYLYLNEYKYQTALDLAYKAAEILEDKINYPNSGLACEVIGGIYEEKNDHERADKYYKIALEKYERNNREVLVAQVKSSIAFNNLDWGKPELALEFARQATDIAMKINGNFASVPRNCLALAFAKLNQLDSAIYYLKLNQRELDPTILSTDLYNILVNHTAGMIYLKARNYKLAESYFLKAIQFSSEFDAARLKGIFKDLAEVYSATGRFREANLYYKKHIKFTDSISQVRNKVSITDLETRYLSEKKEKENQMLKASLMVEQADAKTRKWQLTLAVSVVFLGVAGLLILYRSRLIIQRKNLLLAEQNSEIQAQNEEIISQTELLKTKNDFLEIQNRKLEELNQEKDGLMGIVAHDLRAPLNRAKGLAGLLKTRALQPEDKVSIEKIVQVSNEGLNLIRDILEVNSLSHESAVVKEGKIVLNEFIENEVLCPNRIYAQTKSIELISVIDEKIEIETEPSSLKRILENLVSNAIKFSPPSSHVLLHVTQDSQLVSISVQDEGPGISIEDQKKMFRKFQRLSARPTGGENSSGLGLAVVKALVEKLRGAIEVDSDIDAGTEFIVKLPKEIIMQKGFIEIA